MKRTTYIISFLLLCLFSGKAYCRKIKNFELKKDAITIVNTSPGYTTLIEVPSRPTRVVAGNQDSFKIEFIGKNVAVKPLLKNVKTNLFIFTKEDQFHLTLKSGTPDKLQYIVRLKNKVSQSMPLNISRMRKNVHIRATHLNVFYKSRRRELSFLVKNKRRKAITVNPESIALHRGRVPFPISEVYLDSRSVLPKSLVQIKITFLSDAKRHFPLNLSLPLGDDEILLFPLTRKRR